MSRAPFEILAWPRKTVRERAQPARHPWRRRPLFQFLAFSLAVIFEIL